MRFSNSTGKLNVNLLYAQFKKVEEFEQETHDVQEIERKYTHKKSPSLSSKKRSSRKPLELIQFNDDFQNLSLEKQVEVVMRPITNPGKRVENLLKLLEDKETSKISSKETEKLLLETEDFEINPLETKNILKELKFQSSSVKAAKNTKESISLPPVRETDPFFSTQAAKHWHFKEPVKNTPRNLRGTMYNGDPLNSTKKNDSTLKLSVDKSTIFFSQSKRRSKMNNGPILNNEMSVQKTLDTQNTSSSSRLHRVRELNLSTKKKLIPNQNLLASLTPNNMASDFIAQFAEAQLFSAENEAARKEITSIQNTEGEGNNLLNLVPINKDLQVPSGNAISLNQIKSRNLQIENTKNSIKFGLDDEKVGVSFGKIDFSRISVMNRSKSQSKPFTNLPMNLKEIKSPQKKKEYYGKWFMPVNQWRVAKETVPAGKIYEELKKDINYFYHNLHNYTETTSPNQTRENFRKNNYRINFENLQEKLKQNFSLRKYKKELIDNEQRIPNFLKTVEEDTGIVPR